MGIQAAAGAAALHQAAGGEHCLGVAALEQLDAGRTAPAQGGLGVRLGQQHPGRADAAHRLGQLVAPDLGQA